MLIQHSNSMTGEKKREARSIHVFLEKFSEGDWYDFKVLKVIQIPGDEHYYVLESPRGNRMLMPMKYYGDYGISPGGQIRCRVDKINCAGKMYLEPDHPFYKPGNKYSFLILRHDEIVDRKGRNLTRFFLKGSQNDSCFAFINSAEKWSLSCRISANLQRIRKGVLILNEVEVINNC